MTTDEKVAFDKGYGQRCISHSRSNPYDPVQQADSHTAFERGWQNADTELNAK